MKHKIMKNQYLLAMIVITLLAVQIACGAALPVESAVIASKEAAMIPGTLAFISTEGGLLVLIPYNGGFAAWIYNDGVRLLETTIENKTYQQILTIAEANGWGNIPTAGIPAMTAQKILDFSSVLKSGILPTPLFYVPCPDCLPATSEEVQG